MYRAGQFVATTHQHTAALNADALSIFSPHSSVKPLVHHVAERLQKRLTLSYQTSYPISNLEQAVTQRQKLLARSFDVQFEGDEHQTNGPWSVSLAKFPLWISPVFSTLSFNFTLNDSAIQKFFTETPPEEMHPVIVSTLSEVKDEDGVLRAVTDHVAEHGYLIDPAQAAKALKAKLSSTGSTLTLQTAHSAGIIVNATGKDYGKLQLLAVGASNFEGSDEGRKSNVRKGFDERLNGVVVAPGEDFSFNSVLHNMTEANGWREALGIFNGGELRPVVGAGICQVATTLYRSLVNAGLPVTDRINHSLYVHYYEKYGVGIDATVFPGSQDLVFTNNTPNYILIQSSYKGYEANVSIFGTADGRSVALDGPYFASNLTDKARSVVGDLRSNEIAWIQTIDHKDGSEERNIVLSRYKSIPSTVAKQFAKAELLTMN